MADKAMTLRLSEDLAEELRVVAESDGVSISDAVREAIDKHIADRRQDKDFQVRLRQRLAETQEVYERLCD